MKAINVIEILSSCTRVKVYTFHDTALGIKEAQTLFKELIMEHIDSNDSNISGVVKNAIADGYFENLKGTYKVLIKKSE